ncbi:Universal stress protein A [Macleaya cordata]|uniref:Universal stress protein A n=1 Tax=Macleaya cordata TaxID=56857 RepID=A0A200PWQ2_MACCD|nr:Universal stress protein A [Macleaya cordata]
MATEKPIMIVGIDESEHSFYALQWTMDRFFTPFPEEQQPYKLIIVHSKPAPSSVIGLAGPGAAEVLPFVEMDLKRAATRVVDKAKEITSKAVKDVTVDVVEGDARNVLCDAVDRHHATVLIVGSHGYGALKRAVLGSVSDYCAHHAHCNVMIVKQPKTKH